MLSCQHANAVIRYPGNLSTIAVRNRYHKSPLSTVLLIITAFLYTFLSTIQYRQERSRHPHAALPHSCFQHPSEQTEHSYTEVYVLKHPVSTWAFRLSFTITDSNSLQILTFCLEQTKATTPQWRKGYFLLLTEPLTDFTLRSLFAHTCILEPSKEHTN